MKIQEVQDLFLRKVEIVPFEDVVGIITTLTYGVGGLQMNVRYYLDGQQKEWCDQWRNGGYIGDDFAGHIYIKIFPFVYLKFRYQC